MDELKHQILELRKSLDLSGAEFAAKLTETSGKKYTRSSVNNWEQGQGIKGEDIVNICKCFHVSADSLLFRGPLKYRSDEQEAVNAVSYTGLSHKSISVLHDLKKRGYDFEALNFLLESISFFREVISPVQFALHYFKKNTLKEKEELTDNERNAIKTLTEKGYFIGSYVSAIDLYIRSAGDNLAFNLTNRTVTPDIDSSSQAKDEAFLLALSRSNKEEG